MLSAGHGDGDQGAVNGDFKEADEAIILVDEIAKQLKKRTGDYWLIPTRVATGRIEWPQADDLNPQPLPPHGVEHHYAPLGFVSRSGEEWQVTKNCQCDVRTAEQLLCARGPKGGRPANVLRSVRKSPSFELEERWRP